MITILEFTPQFWQEGPWWWYIISFFITMFLILVVWNKLQFYQLMRGIERSLKEIELMRDDAIEISLKTLREIGKPKEDPTSFVKKFIEYTFILPTDLDPTGIVWKLDHLLNVRDSRFKEEVRGIAPKASMAQINNLTNLLEATLDLNMIYKIVRHYYLLGKRTKSLYIVVQIHMFMPLIIQIAKAYVGAVYAFSKGYPIGDGAGAMVAGMLMQGKRSRKIGKDIVYVERKLNGRKLIVLKSEGPGGNVGNPGDAIKLLLDRYAGKVSMVIMVDAQLKFEGEKSGTVVEGVGAAIGGIGTEKFKIEEISLKYKIPLYAVLIKESMREAISPMKKEIVDGAREALNVIKRIIEEKSKKGETIIIAGIGNTIGIGQ